MKVGLTESGLLLNKIWVGICLTDFLAKMDIFRQIIWKLKFCGIPLTKFWTSCALDSAFEQVCDFIGFLIPIVVLWANGVNSSVAKGRTQKLPPKFKIVETYWHDHSFWKAVEEHLYGTISLSIQLYSGGKFIFWIVSKNLSQSLAL
jgi:hypothetical protein